MFKRKFKKLMSCFLSVCTAVTLLSGLSVPAYAAVERECVFENNFEDGTQSVGTYVITQGKVKGENDPTDAPTVTAITDKSKVIADASTKALRLFSNSSAKFTLSKPFDKNAGVLHIQFAMKGVQLTPEGLNFNLYNAENKNYVFMQMGNNKLNPPKSDGDWRGDWSLGKGISGYWQRTYDADSDSYTNGDAYVNGVKQTDATKYADANVYNKVNVYVDLKNGIIGYDVNGQSFTQKTSDMKQWSKDNKPELTQISAFSLASHMRDKYMGANNTNYQLYYGDIYYDDVKAEIIKDRSLADIMFTGVYDVPVFADFDGYTSGKDGMVNFPEDSTTNIAHKGKLDLSFNQTYKTGKLYIGFDIAETMDKVASTGVGSYIYEQTVRTFSVKLADNKNCEIAGIRATGFGLQNLENWQKNVGSVTIARDKNLVNRIDLIFDFDNGSFSGFLNGVKLGAEQKMQDGSDRKLSVLLNGIKGFSLSNFEREQEATCVIDNFKATHFDEGFTAVPTVNAANKTVDIEFGTSLTNAEMTALTAEKSWTVDNGAKVEKAEKITQSRIRLTMDKIDEGTVYTLTVPQVDDQDISGVANVRINSSTVKYSAAGSVKNVSLIGVDGKAMFLSNAEPGATVVTVDADFTPNSITLTKDGTTVVGTKNGNVLTLSNPITAGDYVLNIDGFVYNFTVGEGRYVITSYGFTNASGNALADDKAMLSGGSYKFTVSAKNTTGENKTSYAVVAYYGENNKMLGAVPVELSSESGYAMQSGTVEFTVPAEGVKQIKAFMWDGLDTITPLTENVVVEATE